MHRIARRLRTAIVVLALGMPLVCSVAPSSAGLIPVPTGPAVVPHDQKAAIYDLFGASPPNRKLLSTLQQHLAAEGYDVKLYRDSTEGAGGRGGATLANFVKMSKTASVIVINTHGTDFAGRSQSCALGKGVARLPGDGNDDVVTICRKASQEPVQQVEWYPNDVALHRAYTRYVTVGGFKKAWLYESPGNLWASTLIGPRSGDGRIKGVAEVGFRPWLGLTASGIEHFFGGRHVDLIDNLACHSIAFAPSFDAGSYLGHANTACMQFESKDEPLLFDRLTGHAGVRARSVVDAFALGGFTDTFFRLSATQDVVLSPAVESSALSEGQELTVGVASAATLGFDAKMDTSDPTGVVKISGCGATISGATWNGTGTALSYTVNVPKEAIGGAATLTVSAKAARAGSGDGPNASLDGNEQPAGSTGGGVEPNGDDYVVHLVCRARVYPVQLDYRGTYQDDYQAGGFAWHETLTWHETQTYLIAFRSGAFSWSAGPASLTASGSLTTTGRASGNDSCTIASLAAPWIPMIVNTGSQNVSGTGPKYIATLQAQMPIATQGANASLTVSGDPDTFNCYADTHNSIAPYLFYHPFNMSFNPPGLGAAWSGFVPNVDLDGLVAGPFTMPFTVDSHESDGFGDDHVVVNAVATVSLTGPPTGS